MAKPDENKNGGTNQPPKEGKTPKAKTLQHTLKDNRLFIPGVGLVEKENFSQEHFDALVKLEKDAVKKYLVKIKEEKEEGETEE